MTGLCEPPRQPQARVETKDAPERWRWADFLNGI